MDTTATQYPPAGHEAGTAHDAGTAPDAGAPTPRPQLYRPFGDRMLAGVASGVARYFGIDVTVVRIVLAVLAVVGGAGMPLYLAGWLLIPDEDSGQSIASAFISSIQDRSR